MYMSGTESLLQGCKQCRGGVGIEVWVSAVQRRCSAEAVQAMYGGCRYVHAVLELQAVQGCKRDMRCWKAEWAHCPSPLTCMTD